MKKGLIVFMAFLTGGISGGVSAALYFRNKYKKIADTEVKSVKEAFAKEYTKNKTEEPKKEKDIPVSEPEKEPKTKAREEYEAANPYMKKESAKSIEILTPEEFNASGNPYKTLHLYTDGVLAYYDTLQKMTKQDILLHIGPDALSQIGKYEDGTVYVRNNKFNTDYEVIRQAITYKSALEDKGASESAKH